MELSLTSWTALLGLVCLILLPFAVPGILEALLALAVASFISAGLLALGWLPAELAWLLPTLAVGTLLLAAVLYKPLRRLQQPSLRLQEDPAISDFVGTPLVLQADLQLGQLSHTDFSGVRWQLQLAPDSQHNFLPAGTRVVIVSAHVGKLTVRAAAPDESVSTTSCS